MTFVSTPSPFLRKRRKNSAHRGILRERLFSELRNNVAFACGGNGKCGYVFSIRTPRAASGDFDRDYAARSYEFQVSRPEAILKPGADGQLLEPLEVYILKPVPIPSGTVVEMLGTRKGKMIDLV
jgi:GTP-binding protein